ncbi:hypothetical protein [Mesorhizobium sp. SP-1A]|uniref:hypothetical protein n=1 Tax=Mesorhizobium sp. SP-1A TaxID=3077840 RepID=UPI0028F7266B|nr:hypothetical protein [Mesorhizobium sp. SP-1A]
MLNFGTSAYLKLLSLNSKPRDTEIKKRLQPSDSRYDYYKEMRRIASNHAANMSTWIETQAAIQAIKRPAERRDAGEALKRFIKWLDGRSVTRISDIENIPSPSGLFQVKFQPNFELEIEGTPTRVHIWNTQNPKPRLREAIGVLGLFVQNGDAFRRAILSLRTGELFVAQNAESVRQLATLLALDIEKRIQRIQENESGDHSTDDRPSDTAIG